MREYQRNIYVFISDENRKFLRATQGANGVYTVARSTQPYPVSYNPTNMNLSEIEIKTNDEYFSPTRFVTGQYEFVKDAAAILRDLYYNGKGSEQKCYMTVISWNGDAGIYELSLYGRLDLSMKSEDEKKSSFSCNVIDDSAWGNLSVNDDVEYSIECNQRNPKAIRVLLDGINLYNKITYQTVQAPIIHLSEPNWFTMPFVLAAQDGDSVGLILQSQSLLNQPYVALGVGVGDVFPGAYFLKSITGTPNVRFSGSISLIPQINDPDTQLMGDITIMFVSSKGKMHGIFSNTELAGQNPPPIYEVPAHWDLVAGQTYTEEFDFSWDLEPDESVYLTAIVSDTPHPDRMFGFTPIVTNISVGTKTIPEPRIVYAVRPLDIAKELVKKATNGRFTINSSFFEENNKNVVTSGDALRGIQNSMIYTTFKDFFKAYNSLEFLALVTVGGELRIEKAVDVYSGDNEIIDLGDAISLELIPAKQYYCNKISVGCEDQDFRHPSGRLEFNSENKFSLPILSQKKDYDIVSPYRTGCYDITFLIQDYLANSTVDNKGDKSCYILAITDDIEDSEEDILTAETFDVNNSPLFPRISNLLNGDIINNQVPIVRGYSLPSETINIYVDGALEGSATADSNGNWSFQLINALSTYVQDVSDGVHLIQATYTNLGAPTSDVTLVIDSNNQSETRIVYPSNSQHLYNNKPLLKGVSQSGNSVQIWINSILVSTQVSDNSCKWEYKISTPLPNGVNTINITDGVNSHSISININSSTQFPMITFIGRELDGLPIFDNTPLIQGVAIPGTVVSIWLNYIPYSAIGSATADSNGNWSFQTTSIGYNDPVSGIFIVQVPIRNGSNVLSTSLDNKVIKLTSSGYKLNRPDYDAIYGVNDNTVFNTTLSPKRMLKNHYPMISAILKQQPLEKIYFQKASKNGNLRTILGGVEVAERNDVLSSEIGEPIALLEYANMKINAYTSFIKTFENFSKGGFMKVSFNGAVINILPIGGIKINSVHSDKQEWKCLISNTTSYTDLLLISSNVQKINLMENSVFRSVYNTLHMVLYNFEQQEKYNFKELYQDWFKNRNDAWAYNPLYIQKVQFSDTLKDQIVSKGVTDIKLCMYECSEATKIAEFPYQAVSPAPIPGDEVVMETEVDTSSIQPGRYFFTMEFNKPTLLTFNIGENDAYVAEVEIGGTPTPGEVVTFKYTVNGTTDVVVSHTVTNSDTTISIATAIYNQLVSNPLFNFVSNPTGVVYVEVDENETISVLCYAKRYVPIAISEKIELATKFNNTIYIEAKSSKNLTGAFFSTGWIGSLRVEGLVKKIQPKVEHISSTLESGNSVSLHGMVSRKRVVRYGTAYGLPDYLYMKVSEMLVLDDLSIEGVKYVLDEDESIEPSDDVEGHPLYYYNVNMLVAKNQRGKSFATEEGVEIDGIVLIVEGKAFGQDNETVNISLDND